MNISLTPELEQLVHDKVKSGRYNSATEVVREALLLLVERDELRRSQLEELKQKIKVGLEQLDAGRSVVFDEETLKGIKLRSSIARKPDRSRSSAS
jgi:antitoxin ParD1/3/4